MSIELTSIIIMAVGFTFWLAGLSFQNKRNADEIRELKMDHKGFGDQIREEMKSFRIEMGKALHSINSSLFRLEGRLESKDEDRP